MSGAIEPSGATGALVVHPPRAPAVIALATGLVGVAGGVLLLTGGGTPATIAAVVLLLFFGATALGGLLRLARRRPVLTVTGEGLTDRGSLVAAGFLPWSAVGTLDVLAARRGGDLLVVGVHDPEEVLSRASPTRARVARQQAGLLGSPVIFPPAVLPRPAADLRDEIERRRPG